MSRHKSIMIGELPFYGVSVAFKCIQIVLLNCIMVGMSIYSLSLPHRLKLIQRQISRWILSWVKSTKTEYCHLNVNAIRAAVYTLWFFWVEVYLTTGKLWLVKSWVTTRCEPQALTSVITTSPIRAFVKANLQLPYYRKLVLGIYVMSLLYKSPMGYYSEPSET